MASLCREKNDVFKGNTLLVTIEDAIDDVLLVCYNNGARLFRGALLADDKRNMPLGVNVSRATMTSNMEVFNSDETSVLSPSHQASVKPEISALQSRHTYTLDPNICKQEDRLSPQKDIFCPMRNKRMRPMRLRPTKVYCVKCKDRMSNKGKIVNSLPPPPKDVKKTPINDTKLNDSQEKQENLSPVELKSSPMIKISFSSPKGQDTVVKIPPKPQSLGCGVEAGNTEAGEQASLDHQQYRKLKRAFKKARMEVKRARNDLGNKRNTTRQNHKTLPPRSNKDQENVASHCSGNLLSLQPKVILSKSKASWKSQLKQCNNEKSRVVSSPATSSVEVDGGGTESPGQLQQQHCLVNGGPVKKRGGEAAVRNSKSRTGRGSKGLTLVIQTRSIDHVSVGDVTYKQDDVAWGKIQGFPWWPCQVLQLMEKVKDTGVLISQVANVTWFGSSTFSQVTCSALRPFLEEFNIRYNKKKKGAYRNAVNEACQVARKQSAADLSFDVLED